MTDLRSEPDLKACFSTALRHQTCRAVEFMIAHQPGGPVRSAKGKTKRYRSCSLLRSRHHRCSPLTSALGDLCPFSSQDSFQVLREQRCSLSLTGCPRMTRLPEPGRITFIKRHHPQKSNIIKRHYPPASSCRQSAILSHPLYDDGTAPLYAVSQSASTLT